MKVSEIHIGETYVVRRWSPPVKGVPASSGTQPIANSRGFPGYWEHLQVRVVGRNGRRVHTERTTPKAIARDPLTWKVTWDGEHIVKESFDHRRIVGKS